MQNKIYIQYVSFVRYSNLVNRCTEFEIKVPYPILDIKTFKKIF